MGSISRPPGKLFRGPRLKGGIRIDVRAFFDSSKVMAATTRAERRVLTTIGGRIRLTARRSIRKRKSASRPGQPPRNKTGLLRNFITFFYDFRRRSVIIGPQKLVKPGQVPHVLEEGGPTMVRLRRRGGKRPVVRRKMGRVFIKARPYMGPALRKEAVKLPELWRNSIK